MLVHYQVNGALNLALQRLLSRKNRGTQSYAGVGANQAQFRSCCESPAVFEIGSLDRFVPRDDRRPLNRGGVPTTG